MSVFYKSTKNHNQKKFEIKNVVSRSEYREILLARMAAGDLYAAEELAKIRNIDIAFDVLREKPIYKKYNMESKVFKHIMIDLETLGLQADSIIRSCAMVEFDPETGETGEQKEWTINLQDSYSAGFTLDMDAIKWWMMQSEEARKHFVEAKEVSLLKFLSEMQDFIKKHGEDVVLWCLQLDFDLPILKSYYHRVYWEIKGEKLPWNYRKVRDVRPYMDALETANLLPPKEENRHTPITDCLAQINCVHLAIKHDLVIR